MDKLRASYQEQFSDLPDSTKGIPNGIEKEIPADTAICLYAISGAVGYLDSHLQEVKRLKSFVIALDATMNEAALQRSTTRREK